MGWSELQFIPNEYNDEIRAIDESLLQLPDLRSTLRRSIGLYTVFTTAAARRCQMNLASWLACCH
jgi:hypothetical protein